MIVFIKPFPFKALYGRSQGYAVTTGIRPGQKNEQSLFRQNCLYRAAKRTDRQWLNTQTINLLLFLHCAVFVPSKPEVLWTVHWGQYNGRPIYVGRYEFNGLEKPLKMFQWCSNKMRLIATELFNKREMWKEHRKNSHGTIGPECNILWENNPMVMCLTMSKVRLITRRKGISTCSKCQSEIELMS